MGQWKIHGQKWFLCNTDDTTWTDVAYYYYCYYYLETNPSIVLRTILSSLYLMSVGTPVAGYVDSPHQHLSPHPRATAYQHFFGPNLPLPPVNGATSNSNADTSALDMANNGSTAGQFSQQSSNDSSQVSAQILGFTFDIFWVREGEFCLPPVKVRKSLPWVDGTFLLKSCLFVGVVCWSFPRLWIWLWPTRQYELWSKKQLCLVLVMHAIK